MQSIHYLALLLVALLTLQPAEKIAQVLQSYKQSNQFLISTFSSKNLIAVIGFKLKGPQAIIKHISVSDDFKRQAIGNCLIQKGLIIYFKDKII